MKKLIATLILLVMFVGIAYACEEESIFTPKKDWYKNTMWEE